MTRVKLIPLFYTSFIFLIVHSALAQNGIIDLSTLEIGVPVTIVVNGRKCTVTLDPSAPRGYWVEPPECDPIITTVEVDQEIVPIPFPSNIDQGTPALHTEPSLCQLSPHRWSGRRVFGMDSEFLQAGQVSDFKSSASWLAQKCEDSPAGITALMNCRQEVQESIADCALEEAKYADTCSQFADQGCKFTPGLCREKDCSIDIVALDTASGKRLEFAKYIARQEENLPTEEGIWIHYGPEIPDEEGGAQSLIDGLPSKEFPLKLICHASADPAAEYSPQATCKSE